MMIPQVPSNVKMRLCGYCMVRVGIHNALEKNRMSDLQAYVFWWPLCSAAVAVVFLLCRCCSLLWKRGRSEFCHRVTLLPKISQKTINTTSKLNSDTALNWKVIQTSCVGKGVVLMVTGTYAAFPRLKQVSAGSCKQGSSFAMGNLHCAFFLPCQSDLTVLPNRLSWRYHDTVRKTVEHDI